MPVAVASTSNATPSIDRQLLLPANESPAAPAMQTTTTHHHSMVGADWPHGEPAAAFSPASHPAFAATAPWDLPELALEPHTDAGDGVTTGTFQQGSEPATEELYSALYSPTSSSGTDTVRQHIHRRNSYQRRHTRTGPVIKHHRQGAVPCSRLYLSTNKQCTSSTPSTQ